MKGQSAHYRVTVFCTFFLARKPLCLLSCCCDRSMPCFCSTLCKCHYSYWLLLSFSLVLLLLPHHHASHLGRKVPASLSHIAPPPSAQIGPIRSHHFSHKKSIPKKVLHQYKKSSSFSSLQAWPSGWSSSSSVSTWADSGQSPPPPPSPGGTSRRRREDLVTTTTIASLARGSSSTRRARRTGTTRSTRGGGSTSYRVKRRRRNSYVETSLKSQQQQQLIDSQMFSFRYLQFSRRATAPPPPAPAPPVQQQQGGGQGRRGGVLQAPEQWAVQGPRAGEEGQGLQGLLGLRPGRGHPALLRRRRRRRVQRERKQRCGKPEAAHPAATAALQVAGLKLWQRSKLFYVTRPDRQTDKQTYTPCLVGT